MSIKVSDFLSHQDAATINKHTLLNFIRANGPVSRTKIWEEMKMSRASVTQIIKQLKEQSLVFERGNGESRGGRKPTFLEFNANVKYVLVFDWDTRTISLLNLNATMVHRIKLEVDIHTLPEPFVNQIDTAVQTVLQTTRIGKSHILGLGLIMSGIIDPYQGVVVYSAVQQWKDVALKRMMEQRTGLNVLIDTDTNMQALGECYHGLGNGIKNFVMLGIVEDGWGTSGLGTALVLNGELIRGSNHMSGEIGHVSINKHGPLCVCGKHGCLEAYLREAVSRNGGEWLGEAAEIIGLAVSMIGNILDPGMIVLCGAIVEKYKDDIIMEIKQAAEVSILSTLKREVRIERSVLGEEAAVKGMCSLAYNSFFKEI